MTMQSGLFSLQENFNFLHVVITRVTDVVKRDKF